MRYTTQFSVLVHDVGHNQQARPTVICRYLQEAADYQMREEGPSYPELLEQGYAFLLSRLHVKLYQPLYAYDRITVQTWGYTPARGASFERYYQMRRQGEPVAEASSVWALLNSRTGKLCRTDEVSLHYGTDEPLPIPTGFHFDASSLEAVGTRPIRYSDVDCHNHMNNTRYADMLCDFIPNMDRLQLTEIQIHYLAEAPLGDTLTVYRAMTEMDGHPAFRFETRRSDNSCNVRARIDARRIG